MRIDGLEYVGVMKSFACLRRRASGVEVSIHHASDFAQPIGIALPERLRPQEGVGIRPGDVGALEGIPGLV